MTTTDWIIDIALILIVLRQLREERLTLRFVLLPLGIVGYTATHYLHGLPTGGNDLLLIALTTALGALLGIAGGLTTKVRAIDGQPFVRAGAVAATIWVASMTARLGFIIWITHASGAAALGRFSVEHHITGAGTWTTALVLLALTEVVVRLAVIVIRGYLTVAATAAAGPRELVTV